MRVFISSVITGYEHFRDAVAAAVVSLGHEVIRAEDFGASPDTPQQACLGGVRDADVVVLLVGARYGAVQPSGRSATDEEYREARESKEVLVFGTAAVPVSSDSSTETSETLALVPGETLALRVRRWRWRETAG